MNSTLLNPDQIRRREHAGLIALSSGSLAALGACICLLLLKPIGILLAVLATAGISSGLFVLNRIPDLVGPAEDLW